MLVGNIDYDAAPGQDEQSKQNQLNKESFGGELLTFQRLKSAPAELESLQNTFREQFPAGKVRTLQEGAATESAFRHEAPQHSLVFVATHGFFAAPNVVAALAVQDEQAGFDAAHAADHSGALCGLAMTGANQAAQADGDDGILTAYEVSALDLRNVDMVILSGCETALGESTPGEGAMSLQRAFQVAGAGTTVASLWSVPDEKTKALMHLFLINLWEKRMPKAEALRAAQIALLHGADDNAQGDAGGKDMMRGDTAGDRTRTNGKVTVGAATQAVSLPPYYWAAFVLSGDWR